MPTQDIHIQFSKYLQQVQKIIYKVSYAYCRDPDERQDLQQEIFLQLWRAFPRYDTRFKASTWTYKISLNVAISFIRKKESRRTHTAEWKEAVQIIPTENTDSFKDERLEILYKLIDKMNELDKALIILYLEDKKYEEIAEILGITQSNVGTKLNRIRKKLKEQINKLQEN